MIVFLQTLLMLREVLMDWLFWRVRGADSPAESAEGPDEDHATAEYDEERGVVFYPPVYAQRYAAVIDLLQDSRWAGRLEKVVDLGYHDTSFIKYLKEVPGVRTILGVDVEAVPLAHDLFKHENYATEREEPLTVVLFQGNAADPDYRLIGCDAVVSIEMVEHMLPHDLDRLIHTVFGFIRPWVAIFTTPNADFNVLFKSMLANGFRNWDHKFEWTREQFNQWCGNIVCRYPDYSVFSHGVGPGPPDTAHLGCCTQLALFVNREYQKRPDLTPNALSLVTKIQPSENPSQQFTKVVAGEPPPADESNCNLEPPSVTILDHPDKSSLTVFMADTIEPVKEVAKVESSDKPAQCDLDAERAKGYLMTSDDESGPTILSPGRKVQSKVYDIEDVNCRLNCSTAQIKRFSAKSSILMSNVKSDSQLRAQEVIGELKHLTQMLNLNRGSGGKDPGETVWNNINWGENAPYWNQYYTIVKEFEYPFQTKSPSERIVDLVSDEIHRIVDQVDDDEWFFQSGRLEIDISRLMPVVKHLTEDVSAVRDLLEWNGYQLLSNKVVYSRLVSDEQDAQDTDAEWDLSEVQSTVASEGTVEADCSDEVLRRAIERKLHRLRSALRNDRDIASELTSVVDKLASLALRQCGDHGEKRQRWMKHKLYDLLSLSEKAVQRRGTPNDQSQTPACEIQNEPYMDIKTSLSSICTQQTFQHELLPHSFEHEEWINSFNEEFNSAKSTEDDIVTLSGFDMSEETTPYTNECVDSIGTYNVLNSSPLNSLLLSSPSRLSPVKMYKQLDRNVYTKGALKQKRSPVSVRKLKKSRNAEIVKALTAQRPLKELKGMVQCFYTRTERRKKAHKKKLRKYVKNLKLSSQITNKLNSFEPMVQLTEKDEDIKSSYSKEIDVFDLSNETESWINRETSEFRERSFTTRGKEEFYAPFFVADNKVYHSEDSQAPKCDLLLDQNDYSEPSTSTGVRHTTAYVQCDAFAFTSPYNVSTSISQYTQHVACISPCPSGQTQSSGVITGKISTNNEVGVSATNLSALERISKGSTLARDGVHFHSFKEKRKNEGVVFQGHWQEQAKENNTSRIRPKTTPENIKKTPLTSRQIQSPVPKIQLNIPKVFNKVTKTTLMGNKIRSKNDINENSTFSTIKSDVSPKIQTHVKKSSLSPSPGREVTKSRVLPKDRSEIKSPIKKPSFKESLTKSKVLKTLQNTRNQSNSPEKSNTRRIYDISHGCNTNRAVGSQNKNEKFEKSPSAFVKSYNANRTNKSIDNVNKRTKKIDSILTNVNDIPSKVFVRRSANRFTLMVKNDSEEVGTTPKNIKASADTIEAAQKENMEPKITSDNVEENLENVEFTVDSDVRTFGRKDLVINKNPLQQAFSGFSIDNNTSSGSSRMPIASSVSHGENDSGKHTASEDMSMSQHTSDLMPGEEEHVAPRLLFDLNNQSTALEAFPEAAAAVGGGREVAGAGDGRGVHLTLSTSDEYSSSLLSTDTSISDAFQLLNLDGVVMAEAVPLQNMPEVPSSSSSGSTAETRVRVEVRARIRPAVGRTGPRHEHSQSGPDADISSADAEVNDN